MDIWFCCRREDTEVKGEREKVLETLKTDSETIRDKTSQTEYQIYKSKL